MMDEKSLRKTLCDMVAINAMEDGYRVSTHCLYPSNGAVTLSVRGRNNEFVISDDGGALQEIASSGTRKPLTDRQIHGLIKNLGLKARDGEVYSPIVPQEAIPAAIILVANAAKIVAEWGYEHQRFTVTRNFKKDLEDLLQRHFNENLKTDIPILGESNKLHKFRHVIYLPGERKLLLDPVVNDSSSINARVVANMDVRMAKDPTIKQYIVYDDAADWSSSDLRLLQNGAQTLPFSRVEAKIDQLAA